MSDKTLSDTQQVIQQSSEVVDTKPEAEASETSKYYFQGFGIIEGDIAAAQDNPQEFTITMNVGGSQGTFPLLVPNGVRKALRKELETNSKLKCGVYPQYHLPTFTLKFLLVCYGDIIVQPEDVTEPLNPGYFVLRGIPQRLPQMSKPKIDSMTIYRNQSRHEKDKIKPCHLPINLGQSKVKIEKFIKGEKPKHQFMQGIFKLAKNVEGFWIFNFISHIHPVEKKLPKYIRPPKQNAAGKGKGAGQNKKGKGKPPMGNKTKGKPAKKSNTDSITTSPAALAMERPNEQQGKIKKFPGVQIR